MSREILDAMGALAREKGISADKLRHALEDALLSAYKKQPGSAKYARVDIDPETADFIVTELIIPERLEAHLIVETIDEQTTVDPETGEMREPEDPEIDPVKFEQYKDQIDERDVTPHDFGRIAAQTAKQVILQRIREAERDMMYEEYRDRVGDRPGEAPPRAAGWGGGEAGTWGRARVGDGGPPAPSGRRPAGTRLAGRGSGPAGCAPWRRGGGGGTASSIGWGHASVSFRC